MCLYLFNVGHWPGDCQAGCLHEGETFGDPSLLELADNTPRHKTRGMQCTRETKFNTLVVQENKFSFKLWSLLVHRLWQYQCNINSKTRVGKDSVTVDVGYLNAAVLLAFLYYSVFPQAFINLLQSICPVTHIHQQTQTWLKDFEHENYNKNLSLRTLHFTC